MADKQFVPTILAFQLIVLIIWFTVGSYSTTADGKGSTSSDYDGATLYHFWIGVHIMMFLGFGGLMQYLHRHGYASIGETFFTTCLGLQVGIICVAFWQGVMSGSSTKPTLGIEWLFQGDFAVAAVLITMGALLGKLTSTQLLWVCVMEIFFYALSEAIVSQVLVAADPGGSMVIHAFGGYFGLACSKVVSPKRMQEERLDGNRRSSYTSDLFAMLGSLFLFIYWPSFNGGILSTEDNAQERAIVNTVFSLAGSCISSFAMSRLLRENRFSMEDVQNATLAGGVAVGSTCTMELGPGGALTIGLLAGAVSTTGFAVLEPFLMRTIDLQDTCGVHNLHAIPGALGGLAGVVVAAVVPASAYNGDIGAMYEGRLKYGRTGGEQAAYQFAALCTVLAIALTSGAATGVFLKYFVPGLPSEFLFMDDAEWEMPDHDVHPVKKGDYQSISNQDEKAAHV